MNVPPDILEGLKDSSYRAGALCAVIDIAADRLEAGQSAASVAEYLRGWASKCDAAERSKVDAS